MWREGKQKEKQNGERKMKIFKQRGDRKRNKEGKRKKESKQT